MTTALRRMAAPLGRAAVWTGLGITIRLLTAAMPMLPGARTVFTTAVGMFTARAVAIAQPREAG